MRNRACWLAIPDKGPLPTMRPDPEYPQTLYNSEFFRNMMYGELGQVIDPPWNAG